jgi:peptidyl-prolyl cis-trans isomerase A (cyclophilin A)
MKRIAALFLSGTLAVMALGIASPGFRAQAADAPVSAPGEPAPNPRVRVTTNVGSFVIELDKDRAPLTVANFLTYVHNGTYANTLFHRVIANFVIQGGGHDATAPDYKLKPVLVGLLPGITGVPNESGNGLQNKRGTVGLARGDRPHSGNCQFFINLVDNAELDPLPTRWGYTVFGRVIAGMDVVDRIGATPTGSGCQDQKGTSAQQCPFKEDWPLKPVVIQTIEELPAGAVVQEGPTGVSPNSTTPPVLAPQ